VKLAGQWIAESEAVLLLHEPGRYPVAYFPLSDVESGVLVSEERATSHPDLGHTEWFSVHVGDRRVARGAWQHTALTAHASELRGRVAFAWRGMDAFYEEDERIVGHAADAYHRIDIRQSSRHLVVKDGARIIVDTRRPIALFESGFAPRWYVPRQDVDETALIAVEGQTFCPYKGVCSYYDVGGKKKAAWSYRRSWPEVARISDFVSFEPDIVDVFIDDKKLALEPGQTVLPHGIDRGLDVDEIVERGSGAAHP
jgi:uncharacterized protein (DUF427 family)